eukprot:TRINITY_DN18227_c0_g1_i3.p1 TRINITY_DN18227_c0_g1~~TRINITY_DN18227_c0_g1_i3.p1  ORF type:complete len:104 (-),score=15.16 TRINITY_DN18227_c0_g1_i3:499-810(-)
MGGKEQITTVERHDGLQDEFLIVFFFFSSRRRHTRCREVSWARRCVQETAVNPQNQQATQINQRNCGLKIKCLSIKKPSMYYSNQEHYSEQKQTLPFECAYKA